MNESSLLTRKQVANMLGKSQATLSNIVNHSELGFPKAIKFPKIHNYFYVKEEIEEWMKAVDLNSLTFKVYKPVSTRYSTDKTVCAFYRGMNGAAQRMKNYWMLREARMQESNTDIVQVFWDDELIITDIKKESKNGV